MNKIKSIFILLIFLIITVGAVSAADVNQTSPDMATDDVVLSDDTPPSFRDLNNTISNAKNNIELNKSYTYQTNDPIVIKIVNKDLTIDGKNNIIDGNNLAQAFEISNSTVTLKNLIFQNCSTPVKIINESKVNTINVTFKNCSASGKYGGAVYANSGTYTSTNDRFIDNYAESYGASIYVDGMSCIVTNATFSSQRHLNWGFVAVFETLFGCTITNSTFENTKSKYSTAIYSDFILKVNNCKFRNLAADLTGGAIAFKGQSESSLELNNCEFINVTSQNNGGAIFADIASNSDPSKETNGSVIIGNCKFINCSSQFGGALLQLGGQLSINNTTFTNNSADMLGGAIYTSYTNATINNTFFINNKADGTHGGAIYFDMGNLAVDHSTFSNNHADNGGAITTYDSSYKISNSRFENKTADKIYTFFEKRNSSITNCSEVDATLNDTTITLEVNEKGNPIIINRQEIKGNASASYFNLKDLNLVTDVRNQGSMGACWAFGAAGAFESAFLIATGQKIDISENNIQNLGLRYSIYGETDNTESGIYYTAVNYFIDWFGAVNETEDVYDELGKISPAIFTPDAYHIVDVILVENINRQGLKEALTKYGALDFDVLGALPDSNYYNSTYHSFYCNNRNEVPNHFVTLVGWDDNFDKNHFTIPAPGNGAWICKNSWGTDWGDEGYFYISYYDLPINKQKVNAVGFVIENTENYDRLYQNTYQGPPYYTSELNTYMVDFTSLNNDIIASVGTYFEKANTPYTIGIYIDDTLVYTQSGKSRFAGFETIKLNQHISVQPGCNFSVQIKSSSVPLNYATTARSHLPSTSYLIAGDDKEKLDGVFTPIKVYTFNNDLTTQNIISYNNVNNMIFTVAGPENANVTITCNGKNIKGTITDGKYDFDLGVLKVGTHEVKISYNNQSFSNYVFIKPTIDTGSITSLTIAYKSALALSIKFYDLNGKPLANTRVNIISAGKKVSAVTNSTGGVSLKVNTATKGSHNIVITNPVNNYALNVAVKVVSRISGNSNVKMYYHYGSTYKVRVKDDYGDFEGAGKIVSIKIGKKTFKVKTDKNGWAKLKIPSSIKPGKYTIKVTYEDNTAKNKLTVKHLLKTKKTVKVKKSAKKLTLKATLKKSKTPLKKKVVKFKVKGKTYKGKTNSKGIVKVTLKKSAIKKLKANKKYTIRVSYLKDTVKSTLKVRR